MPPQGIGGFSLVASAGDFLSPLEGLSGTLGLEMGCRVHPARAPPQLLEVAWPVDQGVMSRGPSASSEVPTEPGKGLDLIPPSAKGCEGRERDRLTWWELPSPQCKPGQGLLGEIFQTKTMGLKLGSCCNGAEREHRPERGRGDRLQQAPAISRN